MPPHGSAAVQYTGRLPEGGRCFLRVRYLLRYPVSGLKEGWELGFDEAELPEAVSEKTEICGKEKLPETGRAALILDQTERRITVTGKDFTYVYDTFLGVFSEIKKGEKGRTVQPFHDSRNSGNRSRRRYHTERKDTGRRQWSSRRAGPYGDPSERTSLYLWSEGLSGGLCIGCSFSEPGKRGYGTFG